ncbi:MAG: pilus assembly protein PilM [Chloroflexi bacterium]|nr:pilus assembly protein PilM [Chloroflexota bacterium]
MRLPFLSSSRDIVTLSVDSGAVRLLTARGGAVVMWASAPLEPGLLEEGIIQQPEEVGKVIAAIFQEHHIPKNRVVTSIPGAQAIYRIFSLPAMRQEDLSSAVIYQLKRELPLPAEELALGWQLLGTSDRQQQIFAVGVPRDIIGPCVEAFRVADLKPKAIDVKPLALARVTQRSNVVVGNIETDSVDIVCLLDYAPVIVRSLYFPSPAVSALEMGQRLADELHLSVRSYNDNNRQHPIGTNLTAFLTGGGSDYFSLAEALYGTLEFTLERLSSPLGHPADFPVEEYATNLGLALKGNS